MKKIEKAKEITDARISFVSLVDKAANKKDFLIVKADDEHQGFTTDGRILKVDSENHFVTGIVYEPYIEDAHGNYMTADEIQKAAYWYAKNGDKVDLQHNFEEADGCAVVENWVTKSDEVIGDETVVKGTWLMTVEIADTKLFDKIEKKEITGLSMGGVGRYSKIDTDLGNIEKGGNKSMHADSEKKGIFKQMAEAFGFSVVEKGEVLDKFQDTQKGSSFWNAMSTFENVLSSGHWDYHDERYVYTFEDDSQKIKTALEDLGTIITQVLSESNIAKSLSDGLVQNYDTVLKAGKKMSDKNKTKLDSICQALSDFKEGFNNDEEENEVKKEDIQKMIDDAITKSLTNGVESTPEQAHPAEPETFTAESVRKMIDDAITKSLMPPEPQGEEDNIADMINEAVTKAVEPLLRARGVPQNLNDDGQPIVKSQPHYLAGLI